jgi:hypothetical protein
MRTTIRLPDDLYRRAKSAAAEQGRSFTAYLEDAVRRSLAFRDELDDTPYRVDPLPGAGGLRDGVDLDDNVALLDAMDGR